MDPLRMQAYKIHAINKYKRQQLLNNVVLYTLTTLICTLFCASPLWYPPLCVTFNVFLLISLPKITSLFFSSKFLFIIGNLIVIFLVGESKIFSSKTSSPCDVYYSEHLARSRSPRKCSPVVKKQEKKVEYWPVEKKVEYLAVEKKVSTTCEDEGEKGYWIEKVKQVELDGEYGPALALPAEDLNKLADDFIARVNRRRRLEAELFSRG